MGDAVTEVLTTKQVLARQYYRKHKAEILASKKKYQAGNREKINESARKRRRRNSAFNRRCFICGGAIVTDGEVYSCMNPECEADFVEVE